MLNRKLGTLWESAGRFSSEDAYPGIPFPNVEKDARCVLCQQFLGAEGRNHLVQLRDQLTSTALDDFNEAKRSFDGALASIQSAISEGPYSNTIEEIALDKPDLAEVIRSSVRTLEERRLSVLKAIAGDGPKAPSVTKLELSDFADYIHDLGSRAKEIERGVETTEIDKMRNDLNELEARRILRTRLDAVLDEIRRKQRVAAYHQCILETRTNSITRKSSEVTKRAVTGQLVEAFKDELRRLDFRQVEVELKEAGGSRGSLYHKLILTRAPGAEVGEVVSEGEARCLSMAAFFSELSTAEERSAILFDDPVSSLDHNWRHNVAARLVEEARKRQVIVFTHDLVFWHALSQEAKSRGVGSVDRFIRRTATGAGVLFENAPSPAMSVSKRLASLRNEAQTAAGLFRRGDQEEYERRGADLYGFLRETWERGVEEVLLAGIVERYRPSVQTLNKILYLSDISPTDCETVQGAMSKCSTYMRGHDMSPADNRPFPEPAEIENDIEVFDSWAKEIRTRRK